MNLEVFKKFVGNPVTLELASLNCRSGTITDFDDFGVFFVPCEKGVSEMLIAWHDINKVIIKPKNFVVIEPYDE